MGIDPASLTSAIVFGGTFDPPHVGHVRLPELAMRAVGAEAVIYVPAAVSPFKSGTPPTPAVHRLAMLRLALANAPWALVLSDEIDRYEAAVARGQSPPPSYTVDTLERLRPGLREDCRLRLLIGADQARLFDRWRMSARIVELAEPLVMLRPPETIDTLRGSIPAGTSSGAVWRRRVVDVPLIDISASEVRRRVAAGEPIDRMVPAAVAEYIGKHGLYRGHPGRSESGALDGR